MASPVNAYSPLDRLLHKLAFSAPSLQMTAADIEDTLFSKAVRTAKVDRPIFITSLPRAGTTILLTALSSLPGLATHLYRDMPFIMAPLLWDTLSRSFRKKNKPAERAHGDGISVGYDSPEAFEEVIWKTFWPHKYQDTGIQIWTGSDTLKEGSEFLRTHIRKVVTLRCPDDPARGRYISKNNANIARLELIARMFPDARILVPIRRPLDHAASLLRQHNNFLKLHAQDAFTRQYMSDIGHLEFGDLLKPIEFPRFRALSEGLAAHQLDYWLAYWIAAFDYVRDCKQDIFPIAHEQICTENSRLIGRMLEFLELKAEDRVEEIANHFKPVPAKTIDVPVSQDMRRQADNLYTDILTRRIT